MLICIDKIYCLPISDKVVARNKVVVARIQIDSRSNRVCYCALGDAVVLSILVENAIEVCVYVAV